MKINHFELYFTFYAGSNCPQFPFTFCFEIGETTIKLLHSQNIRTNTKLTVNRDVLLNINAKQGLTATVTTSNKPNSVRFRLGRSWKIWNLLHTHPIKRVWN